MTPQTRIFHRSDKAHLPFLTVFVHKTENEGADCFVEISLKKEKLPELAWKYC